MFLRNCWYVAAWSHELEANKPFARKSLGERVVLFRKESGGVAALFDRCSHRFAPLSMGRCEDSGLRCMYHGLIFNGEGQCIHEPGRSRPSPGTAIRGYPVVERNKQIWIWMGDPTGADAALVPDCWWQDHADWRSIPQIRSCQSD